jgi:hypothetical protein
MPGTALGSRLTVNQRRVPLQLANSNAEQLGVRKQWEENGAQLHVAVAGSCLSRLDPLATSFLFFLQLDR